MEPKFALPSPNFDKNKNQAQQSNLHYLTPCGMTLLPRNKQPPPMYGARGSTVPAKYLQQQPQQTSLQNDEVASTSKEPLEAPPVYDSPPRPEYCSNCGMELASAKDMKLHLSQHQTCPVDECDFAARADILERHIEAQHVTGLYTTVKKVWTPEEIAAWRAERRKKFPTAANVEAATRAREQRMKRGERIEASKARFGSAEDRRRTRPQNDRPKQRTNQQKQQNSNKQTTRREPQKQQPAKLQMEEPVDDELPDVRMFHGTSSMLDYKHAKEKIRVENNPLSSLLGIYGTDSGSEDDEDAEEVAEEETKTRLNGATATQRESQPEAGILGTTVDCSSFDEASQEIPIDQVESQPEVSMATLNQVESQRETLEKEAVEDEACSSSDEGPDEMPIERKNEPSPVEAPPPVPQPPVESVAEKPVKRSLVRKRVSGLNYKRARTMTKPNTMLSKLLEPDVRHERNVLLQCVRYVCEQHFFGIGSGISSSCPDSSTSTNEKPNMENKS